MTATRLNLTVGEDTPAKLAELAGGERKRGEFLTRLIDELYTTRGEAEAMDLEGLRLQLLGLAGKVKSLEARLLQVERTFSEVIAGRTDVQQRT